MHGKVHTAYYQNWKGISEEYFKTVIVARKQENRKSIHTFNKKEVSYTKRQLSELSSTLTKMKAYIAAFGGKPQGDYFSEANNIQEAPVSGDALNYFGGRASKRTRI